jgi:hypothetical protein
MLEAAEGLAILAPLPGQVGMAGAALLLQVFQLQESLERLILAVAAGALEAEEVALLAATAAQA